MIELVLAGGTLVDGSGGPPQPDVDVGIADGRITAIGDLESASAERIDVAGLTVAPGFVDMHAHSDLSLLSAPHAPSRIRQGITTEVIGNCGLSAAPLPPARADAIRRAIAIVDPDPAVRLDWEDMSGYRSVLAGVGPAINAAPLAGHVTLRVAVAGDASGPLDAAAIARLEAAADASLDGGAMGLSTGLMYPPAIFADRAELAALGRAAARHDAVFAVHMRSYTDALVEAVDEALEIARATGCRLQLSHLAVSGRANWGSVARALERIDAAIDEGLDVAFDVYPYLAGSANLSQLLPAWAQAGGDAAIVERLADDAVRDRIRREWRTTRFLGWDEVVVSRVDAELEAVSLGRTVEQVAASLALDGDDAALELIARTANRVEMVAFGRSPDDLAAALTHPAATIGSDGFALDPDGPTGTGRPHPRSYGCYPRLLGRTVRAERLLSLERVVAMSTALPAARIGLRDRGIVREGAWADLVVFDADEVIDEATYEQPARYPRGIVHVLVNGRQVVRDGAIVGGVADGPGRVLAPS